MKMRTLNYSFFLTLRKTKETVRQTRGNLGKVGNGGSRSKLEVSSEFGDIADSILLAYHLATFPSIAELYCIIGIIEIVFCFNMSKTVEKKKKYF